MWCPRMEAKTTAKLACFFFFLMLLIKLNYDYSTFNEDEISSKVKEKGKWRFWITQDQWNFWIAKNKWRFWITQAIPCLFSFCSLVCTAAHIGDRPLNHLKLQDKSTFFQLSIMFLNIFMEMINSLIPTKQSKFLINWLRRSEMICWSVSSIITAYQDKYSFEKKLLLRKRFIKFNCVEKFESTDYWNIVLLLVELIIGSFEYSPAAMAVTVYIRELIKINYNYIKPSPRETLGVLGIIREILGVLGKVGETLLKFILRSFPCLIIMLHTYHFLSCESYNWLWAGAEVGVIVEFLRRGRGISSLLIYKLKINYSEAN